MIVIVIVTVIVIVGCPEVHQRPTLSGFACMLAALGAVRVPRQKGGRDGGRGCEEAGESGGKEAERQGRQGRQRGERGWQADMQSVHGKRKLQVFGMKGLSPIRKVRVWRFGGSTECV